MKKIEPIHPGEILFEEFLEPLSISQNALARGISVPPRRVNEIVNRKGSITADTAIRLSLFFKTTPDFWINLQSKYDLEITKDKILLKLSNEIKECAA